MENRSKTFLLFFIWIAAADAQGKITNHEKHSCCFSYGPELQLQLQNQDFEIPPTNLTSNSTSQFPLLTNASTIPGWSWNGTVSYVSVPVNGHALQLRESGKINQTLIANTDQGYDFFLSFNLIAENWNCAGNYTSVNVSVEHRYKVFSLTRNLSDDLSERHGFYLGGLGGDDSVNLEIASVETNSDGHLQCWPLVDAFAVRITHSPTYIDGNGFANSDFEFGPPFINSSGGVILQDDDEQQDIDDKIYNSPLQAWSILGTVRYIDSDHYKVPQGKAAIELIPISGDTSGIQVSPGLSNDRKFTFILNFTMGDANDSCIGDLIVFVQIGQNAHNFTMRSNGTGAAVEQSITFTFESTGGEPSVDVPSFVETPIVIYSFNETRTRNGVLCGPVLDRISLYGGVLSYGERIRCGLGGLVIGWVIGWLIIL